MDQDEKKRPSEARSNCNGAIAAASWLEFSASVSSHDVGGDGLYGAGVDVRSD